MQHGDANGSPVAPSLAKRRSSGAASEASPPPSPSLTFPLRQRERNLVASTATSRSSTPSYSRVGRSSPAVQAAGNIFSGNAAIEVHEIIPLLLVHCQHLFSEDRTEQLDEDKLRSFVEDLKQTTNSDGLVSQQTFIQAYSEWQNKLAMKAQWQAGFEACQAASQMELLAAHQPLASLESPGTASAAEREAAAAAARWSAEEAEKRQRKEGEEKVAQLEKAYVQRINQLEEEGEDKELQIAELQSKLAVLEKTNSSHAMASERVALTDMKMEEAAATAKRMEDESKDARAAAIKLEEENARLRNELAEMRRVNTELAARKISAPASGTAAPAMAQGNQRAVQWLPVPEQKMTVSKSVPAVPGEALAQNIEVDGDGVAALEQVSELKERPAHLQANKEEPADSAAGGNGNAVSAEISVKAQEEGTQSAAAEAVGLAKEDVGTEERIGQYVAGTSSTGAAELSNETSSAECDDQGDVGDLISKLAVAIRQDRLKVEEAFDAIARRDGQVSMFDLSSAITRIEICVKFDDVKKLFKLIDTDGSGMASKDKWCSVLGDACMASSNLDTSIDVAKGDADIEDPSERDSTGAAIRSYLHRSPEERKSRSLWHFSVALAVQCTDSLEHLDLFAEKKEDFPVSDLSTIVTEWQLDISATDVKTLVSDLSPIQGRIEKSSWKAALLREDVHKESLITILTVVASALLWDVRTSYSAFPFKATPNTKTTLAHPNISKIDLVELSDAWQFCFSEKELDLWFRYLDSSHNGNITLHSWLQSLDPFSAAINAMSRCLRRLLNQERYTDSADLFKTFDKDGDGMLTREELLTSLKSELQALAYPVVHVRIFHAHLTYFTQESDVHSVYLSHWRAGFDLIKCGGETELVEQKYSAIFQQCKQAIATEQLSALVMRPLAGTVLAALTAEKTQKPVDILRFFDIDTDTSCLHVQWHLLRHFGSVTPQIDAYVSDSAWPAFLQDVASSVVSLRDKMATRGAQLLGVLLASHNISIKEAYDAFLGSHQQIGFSRFREIMRRLAPDFGTASPRIESLFLSLTSSTDHSVVCKDRLEEVLLKTAGRLSNKHLERVLLLDTNSSGSKPETQGADQKEPDKDVLDGGERQRLRDVFFDSKSAEHVSRFDDKSSRLEQYKMFINRKQLRLSLSKMGVFAKDDMLEEDQGVAKKSETEKLRVKRRSGKRVDWNGGAGEDRSEDLRNAVTLWNFEREVERSRLSSTFEQIQLHSVFADALCDEMQPEKGICTPLALHQLQSTHLMSWMLSLGEDRLKELLGRTYDMKRGDIVDKVASSILQFCTRQESHTNMSMNSKYSTWAGTFGGKLRKARFGKIEDFKKGLDVYLGMPSFNVEAAMEREHCRSHDSFTNFSPSNNKDMNTCPQKEWDYVVNYDPTKDYPAASERVGGSLHFYMTHSNAKEAGLTRTEVIGLRLYSGPMFMHYNMVLRMQTGKQYITTIHAIVSGIIKLASIMMLPRDRKVYRGLSGIELPEEFWNADKYGSKGGVEKGIMSTTKSMAVAAQYSSYGQTPTIFEIEIGQVDRGAELNWISQFPGEEEVVMPPLSNLEVVGEPYLRALPNSRTQVLIVPLRVNVNIKSKTMEELESTRKDVLLSAITEMQAEAHQEVDELAQSIGEITALAAGQETEWFNDQVAHREVGDDQSDFRNREVVLRRRRSNLRELVSASLNRSTALQEGAGPSVEIRRVADTIISLEREAWCRHAATVASSRKSSSISKQAECVEYRKKNALELDVASSLCEDLKQEFSERASHEADSAADVVTDVSDDSRWGERLTLYKDSVRALETCIGKGDVQCWRDGDTRPVIPAAYSSRAIFCESAFDQHAAFQVRIEAQGESCLAVGVFSEKVFKNWKGGDWSLNLPESPLDAAPIMQVDGGVVIAIRTHATTGDGPCSEASLAINKIVDWLTSNDKDMDNVFEALNIDKDGQLSLMDLKNWREAALPDCLLSDGNMAALFSQLAGPTGGFVGCDVLVNIIKASQIGSSSHAASASAMLDTALSSATLQPIATASADQAQTFAQLDQNTSLGVVLDCASNRISFSIGATESHVATLDGHSKLYVAAVFLGGNSLCRVQLASAPIVTFHDHHLMCKRKADADEYVENLKITLKDPSMELTVGSEVMLTKSCSEFKNAGEGPLKPGETGTIIEQNSSDQPFNVRAPNGKTCWYMKEALETKSLEAIKLKQAVTELQTLLSDGLVKNNTTTTSVHEAGNARKSGGDENKGDKADAQVQDAKLDGETSVHEATIYQQKGLGGKFYGELVDRVGEERACAECIWMLQAWRTAGYSDLDGLKKRAQHRAGIIESCKSSLKSVYGAYVDSDAKARRRLDYEKEQAISTAQEAMLSFFKDSTRKRCLCVHSLMKNYNFSAGNDFGSQSEISPLMREAFHLLLRDKIAIAETISQSLLEMVAGMFNEVDGEWRKVATVFGPEMEVLAQIDVMVDRLSSSFQILQESADTFEQLALDARALKSMSEEPGHHFERDLSKAYALGGIAAKMMQAKDRSASAKECFKRLKGSIPNTQALTGKQVDSEKPKTASDNVHAQDLIWMCDKSLSSETWLLKLYDVDHADTCLAWIDRQCVSSELMRMVEHLDDDTLQQAHCQRRFLAMLTTIEAACKVLPLTSPNGSITTKRQFESVQRELDHILQGAGEVREKVRARLDAGKARVQRRWHIDGPGNGHSKHAGSHDQDARSTDGEVMKGDDVHDTAGEAARWKFKRAESRYWQALMRLYLEELTTLQPERLKGGLAGVKRRSVMQCLELLDDTVYHNSVTGGEASSSLPRPHAGGRVAELHLDDVADEWEARLLGMLSLQHSVCKWGIGNAELALNDIAGGDRKEFNLREPETKIAAFVASFVARSSPNSVRILIRDKEGKPSSMEERPIVLVSGGGLTAHISSSEGSLKLLDFSGTGLTLHGLRVLVEAARSDEDIIEATIAGDNELDLSQDTLTQQPYAKDRFISKSVIEDMRFQSNCFGKEHSEESTAIICNIIAVSARQLQCLNLSHNKLTSAGIGVLARFLARGGAPALSLLNLSDNELQDTGIEYLSMALQSEHQRISVLDIARNEIRWTGALHLAEAIQSKECRMTELDLTGNSVANAGLVALSAALAANETMQSVTLVANQIGDIGVEALTHHWSEGARGSLYSLTALDLSENDITLLGSQKLFVAIEKYAPNLTSLFLSSNRIVQRGIDRIAQLLPSCPACLQSLCLETQRPPHEMSHVNQHQLLVKNDILSDDTCITEQEAKVLALAELRSSSVLKHLSEQVSDFCGQVQDHAHTQERIQKHRENRIKEAKRDWERDMSKRSETMQVLKAQWQKAGKPLSHLNRRDLSLQREQALTKLAECSGDMRSQEAKHYLSDLSYTKALTASLKVKQTCIEDFRGKLFSCLLRPLRAMPGADDQDEKAVLTAATETAAKILQQEIKCSSLHSLVEFQRLREQTAKYEEAVKRARVSSCSASITSSFMRGVLDEQTVFKDKWSSKIPDQHRDGLGLRVLEDVVQPTMCGPLSTLDSAALELLKAGDGKRKKEALDKEEKTGVGSRAFAHVVAQLEELANSEAPGKPPLRLPIADEGHRVLVCDLCDSHYQLTWTEQVEAQNGSSAARGATAVTAAAAAAAESAAADKDKSTPVLVIARSDAALPAIEKHLSTEEEVLSVFEQDDDLKTAWAELHELTALWDVRSGEGRYANSFPMGSSTYWQEVGWLVTRVREVEGPLCDAYRLVTRERERVWAARWGKDLQDFAVVAADEQRKQMSDKVQKLGREHSSAIRQAHALCGGLDQMYYKGRPHLRHSFCLHKELEQKIGGDKGTLARMLETHRLLTKVLGVMSASGLKWVSAGAEQPAEGQLLDHPGLADALTHKTEFTEQEWESFGLKYLREDACIKVDAEYFKSAGAANDDSVKREQLDAIVQEMRAFCAEQVPVLTPDYLTKKTDALLRHPMRLAEQRIEAVRLHVAGCFKAEAAPGGEGKEGRFASATLEGLLAATAQHARDLGRLPALARRLSLDAHLSGSPGLRWEAAGSDKPKAGIEISNEALAAALQEERLVFSMDELHNQFKVSNLSYHCYIKAGDKYFRTAAGCQQELSLPVALAASAPVFNKKVIFTRKSIEINTPETAPLGLKWKAIGVQQPTTGAEIEHPELAAALEQKTEFTQEEADMFKLDNLSSSSYVKVGDTYFTPATVRTYSSVKNDDPPGEGNARSCLDSPYAWIPARNSDGAWMQLDLGGVKCVAGVVTQGVRAAQGHRVEHQYVREITVEYRAQEDQEWLAVSPLCFSCKSGDEKVEHVFAAPVQARYIKISVRAWHLGIAMRAGALEKPSATKSGTIILSKGKQCLVSFPAQSLTWEEVGVEQLLTGTEIKHEALAAALERTANFSAAEWDTLQVAGLTRDSFIAVGSRYLRPAARAFADGETTWCPAAELVDARAAELTSVLPAQLVRELSHLKHLYREGGAAAKGQQAYDEAIKRVGKSLDEDAQAWDKSCEDRTSKETGLKRQVEKLFSDRADWLRLVADSSSGEYMKSFWNLDVVEPKGLLAAMGSQTYETLHRFLTAAGKAIDRRVEEAKDRHHRASGLKWQQAADAQSVSDRGLEHEGLADALTRQTEFTQQEWDAFGIHDLRMDHFVKALGAFFKPVEVLDGDRSVEFEFVEDTSDDSNQGSCLTMRWDREGNPGKEYLELDSVTNTSTITYREDVPDFCNVLSDTSITQGKHAFEFVMHKMGDEQFTGVTADKTLAGTSRDLRGRARCWTYYCGRRFHEKGMLFEEENETTELEHIKDADIIGLIVDFGTRTLAFSKNRVSQATCTFPADVHELYLITEPDAPGDCVELRTIDLVNNKKSLVVTCQDPKAGEAVAEGAPCCAQQPCPRCVAAKHMLTDGLLLDLDAALRECAQGVAAAEHQAAAWATFSKAREKMLPAASEETAVDARVQAVLNRLPAALLAEPQCCRRMAAAVSTLAAASNALPVASTALPLEPRFLVPPFEELAETPSLLRCVELLEQGCASRFEDYRSGGRQVVWEELQNPEKMSLSEGGTVVVFSDQVRGAFHHAVGTPFSRGSVTFELVSYPNTQPYDVFVGVALDTFSHQSEVDAYNRQGVVALFCARGGAPMIEGQFKSELFGDKSGKPDIYSKDGDCVRVDYDGVSVAFYVNDEDEPRFRTDVEGQVRPLALFAASGALRVTDLTGAKEGEERTAVRLSQDRATQTLPPPTLREMSTWESRMFGSLCVSPYALAVPSGDLRLRQLAAGELRDVTLRAAEVESQDAAFLAHFVARCCKHLVRVRLEREGTRGAAQCFMLSPGGGLAGHVRKDTAQTAAGPSDRVLFLASMDVDVAALRLLMEAALAGLRMVVAPQKRHPVPDGSGGEGGEGRGEGEEEGGEGGGGGKGGGGGGGGSAAIGPAKQDKSDKAEPDTHTKSDKTLSPREFQRVLEKTAQSIQSLEASKTLAEGQWTLNDRDAVQAIEINHNPWIGEGRGTAMKLIVQLAHLGGARHLLRLHLDNNDIEDTGIQVLADAFVKDGFAPCLKVLWLHQNRITDVGARAFGDALEMSLKCVTELSLDSNNFTIEGKAILSGKCARRSLALHL